MRLFPRNVFAALVAAVMLVGVLGWTYRQLPAAECAWCHSRSFLNRHHVAQQAARPDLTDEPSNLIVLCRRCHFVLGHRCNWRQTNPDVAVICATYTNVVRLPR